MEQFMNRLYIIQRKKKSKYYSSIHFQGWKEGSSISVHLYAYYLSFRNSMIPFKNLPINCGVPLLVAKISSINDDAHSLRILASLLSLKSNVLNLAIAGALQYKI